MLYVEVTDILTVKALKDKHTSANAVFS